ncbi:carboxypeptidase-like regulatory domain-containing protein [Hymenobacter sp. B1770]|uniref:carboxypeptidase-like regulatory domain-containing protein n=1 Tax=Hymenobacter sp. B1770 TaxID=1718788 RepID=UPI003CF476BA
MPPITLSIPQPCPESWDAMSPAAAGRHCAACQKMVVDFTLKTDAEILAYLAGAATVRICGRFAAGQLDRPLQRAVPAAPTRWRAWLAAAVAVWGLRETASTVAPAQTSTEWRAQYWGGPAPATPPADVTAAPVPHHLKGQTMLDNEASQPHSKVSQLPHVVRGVVLDSTSKEGIPGVTVLLQGTTVGVSTNAAGAFELTVPAESVVPTGIRLVLSSVGFMTRQHTLPLAAASTPQTFALAADVRQLGVVVIMGGIEYQPWPWHPRRFYHWSKYWITRPFRKD